MKRFAVVLLLVGGLVGTYTFRDSLPPQARSAVQTILVRIGLAAPEGGYLGYVEGETTLIAPPSAGRLVSRPVSRGDTVQRGAALFALDPAVLDTQVAQAEAALLAARARLENLLTGRREIEMEVLRAQRREAEAAVRLAEQEMERVRVLRERGITTQAQLDQATSTLNQARARLESLRAQEAAGLLGGREAEIAAARAQVAEASASLDQYRRRRSELAAEAPYDGYVENTFFDVGEWVPAGSPVVALLAPDRIKLRFFVPEEEIARARIGAVVRFTCDGCPEDLEARIRYVSPRSEYTPPVIYSQEQRARLVFLVEATPTRADGALRPGLPVRVATLAEVSQ